MDLNRVHFKRYRKFGPNLHFSLTTIDYVERLIHIESCKIYIFTVFHMCFWLCYRQTKKLYIVLIIFNYIFVMCSHSSWYFKVNSSISKIVFFSASIFCRFFLSTIKNEDWIQYIGDSRENWNLISTKGLVSRSEVNPILHGGGALYAPPTVIKKKFKGNTITWTFLTVHNFCCGCPYEEEKPQKLVLKPPRGLLLKRVISVR